MRQALVIVGVVILAGVVIDAQSNGQANRFSTRLESYQEVPAVSSPGVGTFSAHIDDSAQASTGSWSSRGWTATSPCRTSTSASRA